MRKRKSTGGRGMKRGVKVEGGGAKLLLTLPPALDGMVRTAAKQDGVTVAEWWRAAAVLALRMRALEQAAKAPTP